MGVYRIVDVGPNNMIAVDGTCFTVSIPMMWFGARQVYETDRGSVGSSMARFVALLQASRWRFQGVRDME